MSDAYVIFLIVAGFVAIISVSLYLDKKRTKAFEDIAEQLGFTYVSVGVISCPIYERFKLCSVGRDKYFENLISGKKDNMTVEAFDYSYVTGHGKQRTTHHFTACLVANNNLQVPDFFIRDESWLYDTLGKVFGGRDINFEEDPEFSAAFVLQGIMESQIRKIFNPEVRKAFLSLSKKNLQVEGIGSYILVHKGRSISVKEVPALISDTLFINETLMNQDKGTDSLTF